MLTDNITFLKLSMLQHMLFRNQLCDCSNMMPMFEVSIAQIVCNGSRCRLFEDIGVVLV